MGEKQNSLAGGSSWKKQAHSNIYCRRYQRKSCLTSAAAVTALQPSKRPEPNHYAALHPSDPYPYQSEGHGQSQESVSYPQQELKFIQVIPLGKSPQNK